MDMEEQIRAAICSIKKKRPMIHQITNYVSANDCANVTLALGALPVMADDPNEAAEITGKADALVLNMGTLSDKRLEAMLRSGKEANKLGIPVILDPVGVGASEFRKKAAETLMREIVIQIIRGNLSEIMVLNGMATPASGVESLLDPHCVDVQQIALELAEKQNAIVIVTGKSDIVANTHKSCIIRTGNEIMTKVTGMGCMCSAMIGSFAGVVKDPFLAAISGVVVAGYAGERAFGRISRMKEGPGSFKVHYIDEVYLLDSEMISVDESILECREQVCSNQ